MKYILTLLSSFICCWICAQNITINEIPSLGQLPVNAIHRIFQDKEGYMWYGTVSGLCRDDGYHVQVFRSDFNTPHLLDNNLVECINEDQDNKIWLGTDKGAYILDKKNYSVRALDPERLKDKMIYRIDATSDGFMWVGIRGGYYKYKSDGTLVKIYPVQNNGVETFVGGFCEGRKGEMIITFNNGLIYSYDKKADVFCPYPSKGLKKNNPTILIQDKDYDYYWLMTWGDGIVRFDPSASSDSMYVYQPLPVNPRGESTGVILYLKQDENQGYIWGTSSHNLVVFAPDKKGMLKQVFMPGLLPSSNHMLNDLIKDRWGNLWVSAFDQPSFIVHFMDDTPKGYELSALRKRVNCNPAIMALVDSGDGVMWVSQERTGLCLYNLLTDEVSCYQDFLQVARLPMTAIKEMADTRLEGGAWVVPENHLQAYRFFRKGMNMKLEDTIDLSLKTSSGTIKKVLEDSRGEQLWIGTTKGLYRCDLRTKTIVTVSDTLGFVTSMVEGTAGEIWVATSDKGIYKVHPEGKLNPYPMNYNFSSLSITTDGVLWLGSEGGGVYSFDPHTNKLKDYSGICGMNGDQVNQVMVDIFNHVWIDTNQKVIELNPHNGSFRTYLTTDGTMLLWRLIPTAICKGKDGNIYFGGIPGICSITPSNRLEREAHSVKTLITNVKVMGISLIFGDKKEANSLSAIRLNPEDRNLEIDFSSLNHRFAHKIRYAYRLKGIDKEWIYTSNGGNTAYYSSLSKGSYTFQVKATDENGLWSSEVTELAVYRLPAFYETWWAYLIYGMLIAGTVVYVIYFYSKQLERKNNELWADSEEMMKMRHYLDSKVTLPEPEFDQLDKLLLDKATKAVEDNLTEPEFDVTALASAMNMSRSTLTRKLKAINGRTPLDFIRNIKMKHARHMLEDKDKSVTEVAATLGYFNRKYFTSCFKAEFGMTPSEYQKSLQQ